MKEFLNRITASNGSRNEFLRGKGMPGVEREESFLAEPKTEPEKVNIPALVEELRRLNQERGILIKEEGFHKNDRYKEVCRRIAEINTIIHETPPGK